MVADERVDERGPCHAFSSCDRATVACDRLSCDDHPLHLARSFVDAQGADLAVQSLGDVAARHAERPEELDGTVDRRLRAFRGDELRHRGLSGRPTARDVAGPRRAVREQCAGIDGGRHIGEGRVGELEVEQPLPEHPPGGCVVDCRIERAPGESERRCGDARTEDIERPHRQAEAFSRRAEQAVLAGPHALETQ